MGCTASKDRRELEYDYNAQSRGKLQNVMTDTNVTEVNEFFTVDDMTEAATHAPAFAPRFVTNCH